jgi:hypothetical protein
MSPSFAILRPDVLLVIAVVIVSFFAAPTIFKNKSLLSKNAKTKPYNDFNSFYPFYVSQHQDATCRRLHVIGTSIIVLIALFDPRILISLILTAMVGNTAFLATKQISHGLYEMLIMFGFLLYIITTLTGNWKKAVAVPLIGYTFAWVGHFFFEHNKPATFIYPAFSLAGDFRLWFEVVTRKRAF